MNAHAVDQHVQSIGPWGLAGWLLFAMVSMLYYKLWTGTSTRALEGLREELEKARKTIETMRLNNKQLKEERDEWRRKHHALHGEFLELRGRLSSLEVAFGRQAEMVGRINMELKDERAKRDEQYMQLVKLQAKHGELGG